jgi:hypothetical protein
LEALKKRLASREDLLRLFTVCVFPVHVWAYINFFYNAPSLLLRMNTWEIIAVLAYILAFAFIECAIIFLMLVMISIIFPIGWFTNKLVAKGTAIVLIIFFCFIPIHYYQNFKTIFVPYRVWAGLWIILGIVAVILTNRVIQRNEVVENRLINLVERIITLSVIFIFLDFLAIVLVLFRNFI